MTQGTAEVVSLRLAKDTVLPGEGPQPGVARHRQLTHVGDSAKAEMALENAAIKDVLSRKL
jgi:hypothetical protein